MSRLYGALTKIGIADHRRFRLTLRAIAIVLGVVAAYIVSVLIQLLVFGWSAFALIFVIVAAIIEFVLADVLADRVFPFETEQKLSLMEQRLGADAISTIQSRLRRVIRSLEACDTTRVSATVHILAALTVSSTHQIPTGLLQLTDYVGPDGGRKGRITLITQGVIGRCARTHLPEHVDFAHDAEYCSRMVREFGFTKAEADRHTKTGRSYFAYPLINQDKFVGVIYFFTTEPQVFPRAAESVQLNEVAREIVNYLKLSQLV